MNKITVTYPTGSYNIHLGENILAETGHYLAELGWQGRCAVVTNQIVGGYYATTLLESLKEAGFEPVRIDIPDGEQFKTLTTIVSLYDKLIEAKIDRRSPVIALGGGVMGDTAGFAAASYLRGVPFVQIPTTLLAMVDASVGGKTGVDLPQGKNLVGAFKQPEIVIIDTNLLGTLPEEEFRSGMAEVVKHGIIDDPALFSALEDDSYSTTWMVDRAVRVKAQIMQDDPFEQGRRAVLNLGHTFGHAFEMLSNFEMRHGEGVAIGIAYATRLAVRRRHCSEESAGRITSLLTRLNLSIDLPPYSPAEIWAAMATDKKWVGGNLRFILPHNIGDVDIFDNISETDVIDILSR